MPILSVWLHAILKPRFLVMGPCRDIEVSTVLKGPWRFAQFQTGESGPPAIYTQAARSEHVAARDKHLSGKGVNGEGGGECTSRGGEGAPK